MYEDRKGADVTVGMSQRSELGFPSTPLVGGSPLQGKEFRGSRFLSLYFAVIQGTLCL